MLVRATTSLTSAHGSNLIKSSEKGKIIPFAINAIITASRAWSDANEKPLPKLVPIFLNPDKEVIEKRISAKMEQEKTGITHFYHGTHHIDSILKQAKTNPEGKLDRRACDRGDDGLGLYGTACPKETAYYSGAEYIVRVASEGDVHFDPARGTPALKAFDDKHVIEVFKVENRAEILSHKRPSLPEKIAIIAKAVSSVLPKTQLTNEEIREFQAEIERPLFDRA